MGKCSGVFAEESEIARRYAFRSRFQRGQISFARDGTPSATFARGFPVAALHDICIRASTVREKAYRLAGKLFCAFFICSRFE